MTEYISDQTDSSDKPTVAKVTVEGPGISITRSVNEATMSSIIALLFGVTPASTSGVGGGRRHHERPREQPDKEEQLPGGWDEDLTLGEFIVETDARTFPQKICAAGYYLIKFQHAESFNREDIKTSLTNAHEDMPGNFARDWSNAASSNLIAAKQGDPGQFYVPRTGRTAVESRFQDTPKRRNTRRATKKTNSNSSNEELA
ncbi:hypothetical protein [Amycolatopsis alkalitolerans]|uniref:Uncharacterized protein n=1 Tax=Amycolatopsis alkalitolerans TaxID=2547244 RepID=A0A5C4LRM8_9PSEU|nr:hypothetical protein [Amycolatopsis alkalitolerans]TNC20075.1 hypothetical protein FG385_31605 [Amycolatopsis alkalitolerans]